MQILIVDDDESVVRSIVFILKNHFDVTIAKDLKEAQKEIQQGWFDLAIVDYRIGLDDGIRFAAEMKMRQPQMPIILISGNLDKQATIQALRAKVDDVIEKPFSKLDLLQTIRKMLTGSNDAFRLCSRSRRIYLGQEQFELTPTEFRILEILFENKGQSVTKEFLQNAVLGYKVCSRNLLDTHIYNLRKKVPPLKSILQNETNLIWLKKYENK